jgi:hypothetical protein
MSQPGHQGRGKRYPYNEWWKSTSAWLELFCEDTMPERLTVEQRALKAAVKDSNSKAWAIGLGLTFAFGLFAVTNVVILTGGSNVGLQLLLGAYLPGYSGTFAGSVIGFIYAFVLGYLSGL